MTNTVRPIALFPAEIEGENGVAVDVSGLKMTVRMDYSSVAYYDELPGDEFDLLMQRRGGTELRRVRFDIDEAAGAASATAAVTARDEAVTAADTATAASATATTAAADAGAARDIAVAAVEGLPEGWDDALATGEEVAALREEVATAMQADDDAQLLYLRDYDDTEARTLRTRLGVERVVTVNNFGLIGVGEPAAVGMTVYAIGALNNAAIRAAIAKAKAINAKILRFEPGEYYYGWDLGDATGACIAFNGFDDLTVEGYGATLSRTIDPALTWSLHNEVSIFNCGRFRWRGLSLTQYDPVSTQGTVVSVNGTTSWNIQLDAGFTPFPEVDYVVRYNDGTGSFEAHNSLDDANNWTMTLVSGSTYTVNSNPAATFTPNTEPPIVVGDRLVLLGKKRGGKVFDVGAISRSIHFEDFRIHRAANLIFAGDRIEAAFIKNLNAGGNSALMNIAAAGMNWQYLRRVEIDGLRIEGFGDDYLNVHTRTWNISAASGSTITATFRESLTSHSVEPPPRVGDRISFHPNETWDNATRRTVTAVSAPVPILDANGVATGSSYYDVTLNNALPVGFTISTWKVFNQYNAPIVRARNLAAIRGTARGLLFCSGDVRVDGFFADGLRLAAVAVSYPISGGNDFIAGFWGNNHFRNIEVQNCGYNTVTGQGESALRFFIGKVSAPAAVVPTEAPIPPCSISGRLDGTGFGALLIGGVVVETAGLITRNNGTIRTTSTTQPYDKDAHISNGRLIGAYYNRNTTPKDYLSTGGSWDFGLTTPTGFQADGDLIYAGNLTADQASLDFDTTLVATLLNYNRWELYSENLTHTAGATQPILLRFKNSAGSWIAGTSYINTGEAATNGCVLVRTALAGVKTGFYAQIRDLIPSDRKSKVVSAQGQEGSATNAGTIISRYNGDVAHIGFQVIANSGNLVSGSRFILRGFK